MDIVAKMRSVRRYVASLSLAMVIASFFAVGVAQAAVHKDVPDDAWYAPYVSDLVNKGVIDAVLQCADGSTSCFRPADNSNRAEVVKLAITAFGIDAPAVSNNPFSDVPAQAWYARYVAAAANAGIVSGYKTAEGQLTGMFGPSDPVTRAHAAKIFVNASASATNLQCAPSFSDVAPSDPLYTYIETGYAHSIFDGYADGTFRGGSNINRAEIAKIVSSALHPSLRPCGGFSVEEAYSTSSTSMRVCFTSEYDETSAMMEANYSIMDQDNAMLAVTGVAAATDPMCVELSTDSQTAGRNYDLMVENVMSESNMELTNGEGTFTGFSATGTGGSLTCSAGPQPGDQTVPKGATGVEMTLVNCSASADPVVVSEMTFMRTGAGSQADFNKVYLYDGSGNRLTTGRSINSETQEVVFGGLNMNITSNSSVSFVVVGDITTTALAGDEHVFKLTSKDDVVSNASSVGGSYPVNGSLIKISGVTAGTVTISVNGSLDELTTGQTGRIAQFQLQASGTESMELRRIALRIDGTCNSDDVRNFKLYSQAGELLDEVAATTGKDLATFVLDNPFAIEQGGSEVFHVEAQVLCRDAETVRTYLDQTTDLWVQGNQFNTGSQVVNTAYDGTANDESVVTVNGSEFNVAFSGSPASGDVAVGQDDISCMDLTITNAGDAVEIADWDMVVSIINSNATLDDAQGLYAAAGDAVNYSRFRLARMNADGSVGGTILGPSELAATETAANDDTQTIELTNTVTIGAGESIDAAIVFDIETTANSGDQIRCTLNNLAGAGNFVRDGNDDVLTASSITPAADIVGNTFTLNSSAITFELSSTPSSRTYVAGTQGAELVGISVRSGASLDNTIKSIAVQGYVDGDSNGTFTVTTDATVALSNVVQSLELWDGATKVSDTGNISTTTGKITFNDLNIMVPKSTTKNLTLKGTISGSAPFTLPTDAVKFGIAASTDVTALDSNGKNVTSASITVAGADNGTTADTPLTASDVIMTIAAGGTGTVANSTTAAATILVGASKTELARVRFSSQDDSPLLKDLQFGILNGNGSPISKIYLAPLTGGTCGAPIGSTGGYTSPGTGIFTVTDVNITIPAQSTVTLCVLADVNQSNHPSAPVSGSNVGIALLNVTEVSGGSGTNVSRSYVSTDTNDLLAAALTAAATAVTADADADPGAGNVIVVDQEMMLVESDDGAGALVVTRGFAGTTAAAHLDNAPIGISTIAVDSTSLAAADIDAAAVTLAVDAGTDFLVGDIIAFNPGAVGAAGGTPELALVTAIATNDLTIVRGVLGSTAVDPADNAPITRFPIHGALSRLYKSKPAVALNPANSTYYPQSFLGGTDTTILSFNITASGQSPIVFNTGTQIDVTMAGQKQGAALSADTGNLTCSLRARPQGGADVQYDTVTQDISASQVFEFDFTDANPLTFGPNETYTFSVICDTNDDWTQQAGDNLSGRLASATTTIVWNDSAVDATGEGVRVIGPTALTGPVILSSI